MQRPSKWHLSQLFFATSHLVQLKDLQRFSIFPSCKGVPKVETSPELADAVSAAPGWLASQPCQAIAHQQLSGHFGWLVEWKEFQKHFLHFSFLYYSYFLALPSHSLLGSIMLFLFYLCLAFLFHGNYIFVMHRLVGEFLMCLARVPVLTFLPSLCKFRREPT